MYCIYLTGIENASGIGASGNNNFESVVILNTLEDSTGIYFHNRTDNNRFSNVQIGGSQNSNQTNIWMGVAGAFNDHLVGNKFSNLHMGCKSDDSGIRLAAEDALPGNGHVLLTINAMTVEGHTNCNFIELLEPDSVSPVINTLTDHRSGGDLHGTRLFALGIQSPHEIPVPFLPGDNGTLKIPTTAGTPTDSTAGQVDGAIAVDVINDLIYFRSNGTWTSASSDGSSNIIQQDDSNVEVIDLGVGQVNIDIDGTNEININSTHIDFKSNPLINTVIDADGTGNSITNIEDSDIKAGANINWDKISFTNSDIHDLANVTNSGCADGQILKVNSTGHFVCSADELSSVVYENNTGANVGAGQASVFRDKTGATLNFKELTEGGNVILTNGTDDITISAAGWQNNTGANVGAQAGSLYRGNTADVLDFKTIGGTGGIAITNNADDIQIGTSNIPWANLDLSNSDIHDLANVTNSGCADGQILKVNSTGHFVCSADELSSVVYENNTGANVGAGQASVFRDKTGATLNFKELTEGGNVILTNGTDDITISAAGWQNNTGTSLGAFDVFAGQIVDNLQFRGLAAGDGIVLDINATDIIINSTATDGETNTGANVGAGQASVFRDKTGATLNFKELTEGGNVILTNGTDDITISAAGWQNNTGANVGAQAGSLYRGNTADVLDFKTIGGTGGISITNNTDDIQIGTSNIPWANLDLSNSDIHDLANVTNSGCADGQILKVNSTGHFVCSADELSSVVYENNTGANVGAGQASVFRDKTGATLNFKELTEGGNVILTNGTDDITISAAGWQNNTGANVGAQAGSLYRGNTADVLDFKTIGGTGGIAITNNADDIQIGTSNIPWANLDLSNSDIHDLANVTNSGCADGQILKVNSTGHFVCSADELSSVVYENNTGANVGAGQASVFRDKTGATLNFKELTEGGNVILTNGTDDITISAAGWQNNTGANVGAQAGSLYRGNTADVLDFKTIGGTGGISITNNADDIQIGTSNIPWANLDLSNSDIHDLANVTNSGCADGQILKVNSTGHFVCSADELSSVVYENNTGANVGAGQASVFRDKTGATLNFKELTEGGNVILTNGTDDITISAAGWQNNTGTSLGAFDVFAGQIVDNLQFRGLAAGDGIVLDINATDIIINSTATDGETNTGANVGAGQASVFRDKTGATLNFKELTEGGNVILTNGTDDITISAAGWQNNTGANVGAQAGSLYRGNTADVLDFKTIGGTGGIAITNNADDIQIGTSNIPWANLDLSNSDIHDLANVTNSGCADGQILKVNSTGHFVCSADELSSVVYENNTGANVGAGQASVFRDKTGATLNFKELTEGGNVILTNGTDDITISAAGWQNNTGANVGAGQASVFRDKTGATLNFKELTEGGNVILTNGTDDITISAAGWQNNTGANVGAQAGSLYRGNTADVLDFKTIGGTGGISITNNADDIQIGTSNIPWANLDLSNSDIHDLANVTNSGCADGQILKVNSTGHFVCSADELSSVVYENNTGANVGAGQASVFRDKTGATLNFKELTEGGNVILTNGTDDITISAAGWQNNTGTSLGAFDVFAGQIVDNLQFRGLAAGDGIVLDINATDIIINSTATDGETNTGANVGAGQASVFRDKTGATLNFKELTEGGNVILTNGTDDITISAAGWQNNTGANVGAQAGSLYRGNTADVLDFKTIGGTGGIAITNNADDIQIGTSNIPWANLDLSNSDIHDLANVTNSGCADGQILKVNSTGHFVCSADELSSVVYENNTGANVGAGQASVFRDKTGATLNFKELTEGGNVILTNGTDDITISAAGWQNNTGANVGAGQASVFRDKTGATLNFKELTEGGNVILTNGTDDITISAAGWQNNTGANVGAQAGSLYRGNTADVLDFKTIGGTGGISITNNADDIQIGTSNIPWANLDLSNSDIHDLANVTNSGCADGQILKVNSTGHFVCSADELSSVVYENNTGANVGAGQASVFRDKTGATLNFKELTEGGNVILTNGTDDITISAAGWQNNTGANVGAQAGSLYRGNTADVLDFKTIGGTGGIAITNNADDIQIGTSNIPWANLDLSNSDIHDLANVTNSGCADGQILKVNSTGHFVCSADISGAGGALDNIALEGSIISTGRTIINFNDTSQINFSIDDDVGDSRGNVTAIIMPDSITDTEIATHVSTKITGLPTQTQAIDMGGFNVNKAESIISNATDTADVGFIQMGNSEIIGWESSPAGTDLTITSDSNENFLWNTAWNVLDFATNTINNFVLDCDATGNGCSNIDTPDIIGVAEPKQTILTAAGATLQNSSTPTRQTINGTNLDYIVLDYADNSTTTAIWNWEVPDNMDSTGSITVEARYLNTVASNEIRITGSFRGVADGEVWDEPFEGTAQTVDDTAVEVGRINTATFTFTSAQHALNANEMAVFKLDREGGETNDDNTGILRLIDVKVEWN